MKTFTTLSTATILSLLSLTSAQSATTTVNASQSSAVSAAIHSYSSSLINGPVATSLALEVGLAGVPASVLSSALPQIPSLIPEPSSGVNLYSFATAPPVSSFTLPTWVTQYLATNVQQDIKSLETSIVEAEASIVRSVLSITASSTTAAQTTTSGASSTGAATTGNAGTAVKPVGVMAIGALGAVALGAVALL